MNPPLNFLRHFTTSAHGERARFSRGFTLIEICVVLGIILVLSVLLFPAFTRASDSAKTAGCAFNLRQFGVGIARYVGDHEGFLPPGNQHYNDADGVTQQYRGKSNRISDWLFDYLGDVPSTSSAYDPFKIGKCPADKTPLQTRNTTTYFNYLENSQFYTTRNITTDVYTPRKVRIEEAIKKVLMSDGVDLAEAQTLPPPASFYSAGIYGVDGGLSSTESRFRSNVSARHHGGPNCLFGDGSVRWLKYDDFYNRRVELLDRNVN